MKVNKHLESTVCDCLAISITFIQCMKQMRHILSCYKFEETDKKQIKNGLSKSTVLPIFFCYILTTPCSSDSKASVGKRVQDKNLYKWII